MQLNTVSQSADIKSLILTFNGNMNFLSRMINTIEGSSNGGSSFVRSTEQERGSGDTDESFGAYSYQFGVASSETGIAIRTLFDHNGFLKYKDTNADIYNIASHEWVALGYQPLDATLTALACVVTAADQLIYATDVDEFAVTSLTPFARTLIDDETAEDARATLDVPSVTEMLNRSPYLSGWDDMLSDYTYKFDIVYSFDNPSRTLTVTHPSGFVNFFSYDEYFSIPNGDPKLSHQIPNSNALYTFYFDATGALQRVIDHEDPTVFAKSCIVCRLCFDADAGVEILALKEIHSASIPNELHGYLHNTRGSVWSSGGGLVGLALNDTYFGINSGIYYDEDGRWNAVGQPDSTSAIYPKYGLSGYDVNGFNRPKRLSIDHLMVVTDITAGLGSTGRPVYSWYNPATFQYELKTLANNKYMCMHLYCGNSAFTPVYYSFALGDTEYNSVAAAKAGAASEALTLEGATIAAKEAVLCYTFIVDHNGRVQYVDSSNNLYLDWRFANNSVASAASTTTPQIIDVLAAGGTNVSFTEFEYLSGVTNSIQTQLDAKLASSLYTAADVLSKLLTVDGSNSLLDADLIDGYHASSFQLNSEKNLSNGYCGLGSDGKIGNNQIPTFLLYPTVLYNNSGFSKAAQSSQRGAGTQVNYFDVRSSETGVAVSVEAAGTDTNINMHFVPKGTGKLYFGWSSATEIWHAGNDGAGSSLDADLLDGNHASAFELAANKGVANGYCDLDANGLIPISRAPASLLGGVRYQGTWNAATNTPTIVTPTTDATKGLYYKVSDAGTFDGRDWAVGDWIISNGTTWDKIDNTDSVTSVAGKTGIVTLTKSDVGLSSVLDVAQEPAITKSTGYATWNGSAWTFVNETYSLSSHTHSDYVPKSGTAMNTDASLVFSNSYWGGSLTIGGILTGTPISTAQIAVSDGNLHIDSKSTPHAIYLNYIKGAGVIFGNGQGISGTGAIVASMDTSGQLWKGSSLGAGQKYWHEGLLAAATVTDLTDGGTTTLHSHVSVEKSDLRSTDITTNYTGKSSVIPAFVGNTTDGLVDGGDFHDILHFNRWADASGGKSTQIAVTDNGNMWIRSGTVASTWGSWYKFWSTLNFDPTTKSDTSHTHSTYFPYSGGVISDNGTIRLTNYLGTSLLLGGGGNWGGTYAQIVATDGSVHIDPKAGAYLTYLNYFCGTGGVVFGNGASSYNAIMDSDGQLWKGAKTTGYKYLHEGIFNPANYASLANYNTFTSVNVFTSDTYFAENQLRLLNGVAKWNIVVENSSTECHYVFRRFGTNATGYVKFEAPVVGQRSGAGGFCNAAMYGTNAANAANHFVQQVAGNYSGASTGWISAAFGDNLGSRVVIGQHSGYGYLAAHNADLTDWSDLNFTAPNYNWTDTSFVVTMSKDHGAASGGYSYNNLILKGKTLNVFSSGDNTFLMSNVKGDGSATLWTHINTGYASAITCTSKDDANNAFYFSSAPSAIAGSTAVFSTIGQVRRNGSWMFGTTNSAGRLNILCDITGDLTNMDAGSIIFGNATGSGTIPMIASKQTSSNKDGLFILAMSNNTNSSSDLTFNVRESDNSDFSTLTSVAYSFDRYTTSLVSILRNGNTNISGYTALGSDAPKIKVKKLTGTTSNAEGGNTSIAHGLTSTKIISISVLVEFSSGLFVPPNHPTAQSAGYNYDFYSDATNVIVRLHATDSENILSKNIVVVVTYEE